MKKDEQPTKTLSEVMKEFEELGLEVIDESTEGVNSVILVGGVPSWKDGGAMGVLRGAAVP